MRYIYMTPLMVVIMLVLKPGVSILIAVVGNCMPVAVQVYIYPAKTSFLRITIKGRKKN